MNAATPLGARGCSVDPCLTRPELWGRKSNVCCVGVGCEPKGDGTWEVNAGTLKKIRMCRPDVITYEDKGYRAFVLPHDMSYCLTTFPFM